MKEINEVSDDDSFLIKESKGSTTNKFILKSYTQKIGRRQLEPSNTVKVTAEERDALK
jgi:hypothetical protein